MKNILSIGFVLAAAVGSSLIGFGPQEEDKPAKPDQKMERKLSRVSKINPKPSIQCTILWNTFASPAIKRSVKSWAKNPKTVAPGAG